MRDFAIVSAMAALSSSLIGCANHKPNNVLDTTTATATTVGTTAATTTAATIATTTAANSTTNETTGPLSCSRSNGTSESSEHLNVLQWNPHWECFDEDLSGNCGSKAKEALRKITVDHNLDFANLVEIDERSDYVPPKGYQKLTSTCGDHIIETTTIIYQSSRWATVGDAQPGCMVNKDRAFLIQTFRSLQTSQVLVVVGAHYPHSSHSFGGDSQLVAALTQTTQALPKIDGILFLADTNMNSIHTEEILEHLSGGCKGVAAPLYDSCCNDNGYASRFDRVGLVGGTMSSSELLFDPPPAWSKVETAHGHKGEFHKAVLAKFTFDGAEFITSTDRQDVLVV